jgi:hypothetical protein
VKTPDTLRLLTATTQRRSYILTFGGSDASARSALNMLFLLSSLHFLKVVCIMLRRIESFLERI